MKNQMALDLRLVTGSELVTEMFGQNGHISSGNFNPEGAVVNNSSEEGLVPSQDHYLHTVSAAEALLDHYQYPRRLEIQNTIMKVEVHPHGDSSCDNGDLEKYKELNLPEEAERTYSPCLPSDGIHFLSSIALQHSSCGVLPSSIFYPEGTVNQNVRTIPAEVREAVSNVSENHQDRAIFQSSDADKPGCKLLALHSVAEDSRCSHRNDSNPLVICQLEGGTQILCINRCGTQELNPVHLIPEYHSQHSYLQSDVHNPVTAVLGQLLPVPGELVLNEQE
ncbi:PREDICTED: tesmin-like, partial [Apaloderma vittatum]|uniref:tesmin-like n=1 Tax=Apaloderma vittatum TaxID=57397 RepID=UPI0005213409